MKLTDVELKIKTILNSQLIVNISDRLPTITAQTLIFYA